jgi:hypothetical protein
MDAQDRELFAAGIAHAVATGGPADVDAALAGLGWADAHADDPATAVAVLFEAQGAVAATSSALDHVLAAALGADPATTAVVLPPVGRVEPPGAPVGEGDGRVTIDGLATVALGTREAALVAVGDGRVVSVAAADLDVTPVAGLDPALGLVTVAGVVPAEDRAPVGAWTDAVAAGQLAVGHELVGAARTMLRLAREHALHRVQFDRPIAGFQAVRHRLADTFVAVEAAEAALTAAGEEGTPFAAGVAKAIAGRGARTAARHCQQVLAGIGFTTEHDLHRYVRRTLVLDHLLGDSRSLTRRLGDDLRTAGRLPAILPL